METFHNHFSSTTARSSTITEAEAQYKVKLSTHLASDKYHKRTEVWVQSNWESHHPEDSESRLEMVRSPRICLVLVMTQWPRIKNFRWSPTVPEICWAWSSESLAELWVDIHQWLMHSAELLLPQFRTKGITSLSAIESEPTSHHRPRDSTLTAILEK